MKNRRAKLVLSVGLASLGALEAAPARADSAEGDDTPFSEVPTAPTVTHRTSITGDRVAFLAQLGLGAPAGTLGVEADIAPIRYLAFNFGVGFTPNGAQVAAMVRFRIPLSGRLLIGAGTGISFGRHITGGPDCWCGSDDSTPAQVYNRAYWNNFELALDLYSKRGRGLAQFAIGYGRLLNPNDYDCQPLPQNAASTDCRTTTNSWPFLSAAYGFDL